MISAERERFGAPTWLDVVSTDPAVATAFYTGLFGWTAEESGPDFGNYVLFLHEGSPVAGLTPNPPGSGYPDLWMTYLASADIERTVAAAVAEGGTVHLPPHRVADQGTMAMIGDAAGAAVGVWQAETHTGFGESGTPSTPFWHELLTRDLTAATAFYEKVFAWKLERMADPGDLVYATATADGVPYAGVRGAADVLPEGVPSHWQCYWTVADTDTAAARVVELGGRVTREPWNSAFGRMAAVADPGGASFVIASRTHTAS